MASANPNSAPLEVAATSSQRAVAGGWGSLQEDLLGCIAALLPLRERFGVLPLVCRQYCEVSRRREIAGLGIFELYTPATPLSTQGITRRCRSLGAWLDSHVGQLADLSFDLPPGCRPGEAKYGIGTAATAVQAAIMPAVEKAAWHHRAAFTSLVLSGGNLAAALAAVEGHAPAESGIAACVALRSLEIHNYEGSPTQLAQLLGGLPQVVYPPALQLYYGPEKEGRCGRKDPVPRQLLQGPPADVVCAALQHLDLGHTLRMISTEFIPGLLAFTALTHLQLLMPRGVLFLPDGISQLRHLADLTVTGWHSQEIQGVPTSLASLPLTRLHLSSCHFSAATPIPRRLGGLPIALQSLAPTLRELQLQTCDHHSVPMVVSTLTRLTCLSIRDDMLGGVPAWLTRLQCLEQLEMEGNESCPVNACLDDLPHLHTLGWGGRVLEDLPGAEYLGRLTRLALGSMEEPSWNHPIDISPLEGASRLAVLSVTGYNESSGSSRLAGFEALDGLASLTKFECYHVGGAQVPPEGAYLSRLRSLTIEGYEDTQLPEGLSTATALTELTIDNERMSLDILWEDLAELLPHLPLLQELSIKEHSDMDCEATPFLVADLLGRE